MPKKQSGTARRGSAYEVVAASDVPHERKGKHNALVSEIFSSLLPLQPGNALKIPLLDLRKQKMENVRAAVNRAGKKIGLDVATSSDDYFFYVWVKNKHTLARH
ncbi:MAG TPA: hypothetical protein VJ453_08160 [Terriglobales bacterium]|jgi:hypothetical protein|nr:hypothetical protein [Terriglobales bacterium]